MLAIQTYQSRCVHNLNGSAVYRVQHHWCLIYMYDVRLRFVIPGQMAGIVGSQTFLGSINYLDYENKNLRME